MGIEEVEEVDEAEAGNATMMTNQTTNHYLYLVWQSQKQSLPLHCKCLPAVHASDMITSSFLRFFIIQSLSNDRLTLSLLIEFYV
jgi:hypothetical protein